MTKESIIKALTEIKTTASFAIAALEKNDSKAFDQQMQFLRMETNLAMDMMEMAIRHGEIKRYVEVSS